MENEMNKITFAVWLSDMRQGIKPEWESLKRARFTDEEIDAWKAVAEAANKCLALPKLHGMERHELCHYFHLIQDQILARLGLRALGRVEEGKG